jgi:hypothetical protein
VGISRSFRQRQDLCGAATGREEAGNSDIRQITLLLLQFVVLCAVMELQS